MPITRILVPVDFSAGSVRQMTAALELAVRFGASIEALHVVDAPAHAPLEATISLGGDGGRSLHELARQEAERDMIALVEPLSTDAGVRVTHRIEPGMPNAAVTILDVAQQGSFDLIVMSTHGRSGLEHLLIGSVTEKIVRKASCTVMVTR